MSQSETAPRFTITWTRQYVTRPEPFEGTAWSQSSAEGWAAALIRAGRQDVVITDNLPDLPIEIHNLTAAQVETIRRLSPHYRNFADWTQPFDLPMGWVAGWANGVYYGIDPDGNAHS